MVYQSKMKILFVNTSVNTGSTGRISEEIGRAALATGHECWFAYGRQVQPSKLNLIKVGNSWDVRRHILQSRLLDNHGFASKAVTKRFVSKIKEINLDIVNLHNVHGYYLNIELLLNYLSDAGIPVIWTFHDCWPITGHCSYFDAVDCDKWKTECEHCPNKHGYPKSVGLDRSKQNYEKKKRLIRSLKNLTIVTPSIWLKEIVGESYLKDFKTIVINNGVDLNVFRPTEDIEFYDRVGLNQNKRLLLGVANIWDKRKGLDEFIEISKSMPLDWQILLVGLNEEQIKNLPRNIIGIKRIENVQQLAALYSRSDVFVNPTYVDNFPTTNIEALSCGTPIVTYKTGGSPEAIDAKTGIVVDKGEQKALQTAIEQILSYDRSVLRKECRARAELLYNKHDRFNDYMELFHKIVR